MSFAPTHSLLPSTFAKKMNITLKPAKNSDFDLLVELRIEAMKESLIAIGRFDRKKSIERFRGSFSAENTKKIMKEDSMVGFISVTEKADHLYLDHLYIDPTHQSHGLGSAMMKELIILSKQKDLPIRLGALKSSRSNEFYKRHGFVITQEDEWDTYYERSTAANQAVVDNSARASLRATL